MPYGIPKDKGGDSPENVKKLEKCIAEVGQKNSHLDDDNLIRICKDQTFGSTKTGQRVGGT